MTVSDMFKVCLEFFPDVFFFGGVGSVKMFLKIPTGYLEEEPPVAGWWFPIFF